MADGLASRSVVANASTSAREWPAREKRFSVSDFDHMTATGFFNEPGKHELWDGRIMMAPPAGGPHIDAEIKLVRMLVIAIERALLGSRFEVATGAGLSFNETNLRGPDIMVLHADRREKGERPTPAAVALLIEIADSSLEDDLGEKREKYAGAGIAEYWVVDVNARALHVFRTPEHGAYGVYEIKHPGETIAALFAPELIFELEALI
jgi:Uma2 family endonuclease